MRAYVGSVFRVSSLGPGNGVRFGGGSVAITQSAKNPKHACEISGNLRVGSYQLYWG